MNETTVEAIKESIDSRIGQKIKFKIKKGKNRSFMEEGKILCTYPSIFTVRMDVNGEKRIISFNYIDLLTNYVEFFLGDTDETKIV